MVAIMPQDKLADFCRRWKIKELSLFGSALRGDFDAASDIDLLYVFELGHRWTVGDLARMEQELQTLLSRKVDLVSRRAVEQSQNWIRRDEILSGAKTLYAA